MRWDASQRGLDGMEPAVSNIMPEPDRHGWAELLTLVDAIRRIAYLPSYTMDCDEQMRQIRDQFLAYDHPESADDA
jgi:hypothetical protein